MLSPISFNIALKEWAAVIAALETGRQIFLLRKGGILEQGPKRKFEIQHSEFLLFPTYLHQSRGELKPEVQFEPVAAEPQRIRITSAAAVTDIIRVQSRQQIDRLDDQHIWTSSLIDMRFNYKPQNPLFLVAVRVYRLREPIVLENKPAYAGCKSWVPLDEPITIGGAEPALDDVTFQRKRAALMG